MAKLSGWVEGIERNPGSRLKDGLRIGRTWTVQKPGEEFHAVGVVDSAHCS